MEHKRGNGLLDSLTANIANNTLTRDRDKVRGKEWGRGDSAL